MSQFPRGLGPQHNVSSTQRLQGQKLIVLPPQRQSELHQFQHRFQRRRHAAQTLKLIFPLTERVHPSLRPLRNIQNKPLLFAFLDNVGPLNLTSLFQFQPRYPQNKKGRRRLHRWLLVNEIPNHVQPPRFPVKLEVGIVALHLLGITQPRKPDRQSRVKLAVIGRLTQGNQLALIRPQKVFTKSPHRLVLGKLSKSGHQAADVHALIFPDGLNFSQGLKENLPPPISQLKKPRRDLAKLWQERTVCTHRHQLRRNRKQALVISLVERPHRDLRPAPGVLRLIPPGHLKKPGVIPTRPRQFQSRGGKTPGIAPKLRVDLGRPIQTGIEENQVHRLRPPAPTKSHGQGGIQLAIGENTPAARIGQHGSRHKRLIRRGLRKIVLKKHRFRDLGSQRQLQQRLRQEILIGVDIPKDTAPVSPEPHSNSGLRGVGVQSQGQKIRQRPRVSRIKPVTSIDLLIFPTAEFKNNSLSRGQPIR